MIKRRTFIVLINPQQEAGSPHLDLRTEGIALLFQFIYFSFLSCHGDGCWRMLLMKTKTVTLEQEADKKEVKVNINDTFPLRTQSFRYFRLNSLLWQQIRPLLRTSQCELWLLLSPQFTPTALKSNTDTQRAHLEGIQLPWNLSKD